MNHFNTCSFTKETVKIILYTLEILQPKTKLTFRFILLSTYKKRFWKTKHKWEDNIKMGIEGIMCEDVDWIHLIYDRIQGKVPVNMAMKLHLR
jgi:hypothetical protein